MNGFLLVARMTFDELPLRLFATHAEFAQWFLDHKDTIEDAIDATSEVVEWPMSDLVEMALVEFKDGKPCGVQHVMSFEDQGEAAELTD